jgi:hypothetical protein
MVVIHSSLEIIHHLKLNQHQLDPIVFKVQAHSYLEQSLELKAIILKSLEMMAILKQVSPH